MTHMPTCRYLLKETFLNHWHLLLVGAVALGLSSWPSISAAQPSRIALRVELHDSLRKDCVPSGATAEQIQQQLSSSVVDFIVSSRQWSQFCWNIEPFDPAKPAQGLIHLNLNEAPSETDIQLQVQIGPNTGNQDFDLVPFASSLLLDGKGAKIPRGDKLTKILNRRFTDLCFSEVKAEDLHHRLRAKVRAAKGIVQFGGPAQAGEPTVAYGLVLLPWNEYHKYGLAKFKFRWAGVQQFEELSSVGVGTQTEFKDHGVVIMSCLLARHLVAPVMPPAGPVDVYLDTSIQELNVLPPVEVGSISAESGAGSIEVFE